MILEIQQFGFKKKVLLFELDFIRAFRVRESPYMPLSQNVGCPKWENGL